MAETARGAFIMEPLQSGAAERNVSAGDDKTHETAAAVQNELFH